MVESSVLSREVSHRGRDDRLIKSPGFHHQILMARYSPRYFTSVHTLQRSLLIQPLGFQVFQPYPDFRLSAETVGQQGFV